MSKADDGARPVLVGGAEKDTGITSHGVTRASMLRPGQRLKSYIGGSWHILIAATNAGGEVIATSAEGHSFHFAESEMVNVRDTLHDYTDDPQLQIVGSETT